MEKNVLVLGATGRFGRHAAEAFWNAGWQVRLFDRTTEDMSEAARGADVIVNALNPPYADWETQVPQITSDVIGAAQISGATVIIPGNAYGYGHKIPSRITSDTPKDAENSLGRIRNVMEDTYRAAGIKTIVLRAGDFIDTQASGNWFDMIIVAKLAKGKVVSPGALDEVHAWAYLPDIARATVQLAEKREQLEPFQEVLFPGFALSLREVTTLLEQVEGRPLKLTKMNWLPLHIASPFWRMGKHLLEMRYLWSMPHKVDEAQFNALLPGFVSTDPLTAFASAVAQSEIDPDQTMTGRLHNVVAE